MIPPGGVITVTEPEHSSAAATAAVFLASVLAERDPSVVLVDLDLDSAELTQRLSDRELPGVTDVLAGRCTVAEATLDVCARPVSGCRPCHRLHCGADRLDRAADHDRRASPALHLGGSRLPCSDRRGGNRGRVRHDCAGGPQRCHDGRAATSDVDIATRCSNLRGALRPRRSPRTHRRIRVRHANEGATLKLKAFLASVRRYWKTFVVVAGVVFALGLAWVLLAPAKFVSTTQLMVSIDGSTTAAAYENDEVVAGRVNSYIALLTSDVVNQRVIDRLGLSLTAPELAAKVSATNVPPKTAVIDVAVTDESPAQARLLANTLATEFINYAEALETPTGEDGQKVHTTVVTAASEPREQRFERILLGALAAVTALVLGAVAVWIRSRTDPVVRTADQAAAAAGVPVIGCVTSAPRGRRRL